MKYDRIVYCVSYIANEIDTLEKKYDGVKAESAANCGQLIADTGHKLTTEIQTAKKEILVVIDNKVNEVECESQKKFSTAKGKSLLELWFTNFLPD